MDADVHIDTPEPEFRAWKWADPSDLPAMIVPFKQALYRAVLAEFGDFLPLPAGERDGREAARERGSRVTLPLSRLALLACPLP
jgi:hypothetical protein